MSKLPPTSGHRRLCITGYCGPVADEMRLVIKQPNPRRRMNTLLDLSYRKWDFVRRLIPELWMQRSVGPEQSRLSDQSILESLPWTGLQFIPLPAGALALIEHDSLPLAAQWAEHLMRKPAGRPAELLWDAMAIRCAQDRLCWQEPRALVLIHVHTLLPERPWPAVMRSEFP